MIATVLLALGQLAGTAAILTASAGLGHWLLARLTFASTFERFVFSTTLGLGASALVLVGLSVAGLLYVPLLQALTAGVVLVTIVRFTRSVDGHGIWMLRELAALQQVALLAVLVGVSAGVGSRLLPHLMFLTPIERGVFATATGLGTIGLALMRSMIGASPSATMPPVTALLDRLLHHAHVLKCGPRSWRTKVHTDLRTETATP